MAKELEKQISTWLLRLKGQTREGKDRVTAKSMGDMARMLAADFPPGAFTLDSLHAVAVAAPDGWFPSAYAVLHRLLAAWWRDNKPESADANWPPGIDRLSGIQDRQWFRHYHLKRPAAEARDAERVRLLGPWTEPPYGSVYAPQTDIAYSAVAQLASLIRRHSPAAWGLIRNPDEEPPADQERVQRAVSDVSGAISRRGLFEAQESPSVADQLRALNDLPPMRPRDRRPLTADELAAARARTATGADP